MRATVNACFILLLAVATAFAQKPQVVIGPGTGAGNFRVPYHQTSDRTLSKDTVYVLTGWYFVDSLSTLTIEAGTLVLGDSASGGTLIISRGAKILAQGTQGSPIVFTSADAPGNRQPGDWGGVVLLGNAPTNKPTTQQIEGGFGTIPNTDAMFGGPDPDDSSGVFQFIRIEFGGIAFSQDNEINGLTFGGIGRRTVIDHVQVSFANDDDYEFFGGTVQAKYMIGWRCLDDTYDTDFGFSGKLQFIFTKRDPLIFDASASGSSNGFESDNEGASPYTATPRTSAKISNATIIGPQSDTSVSVNSKWQYVAMLRRATQLSIYNSILSGYPRGIQLRDTLTQRAALEGSLEVRNTVLQAPFANFLTTSSSPSTGDIPGFDVTAWFNTVAYGNTGVIGNPADIGLKASAFDLSSSIDAVPMAASAAATKAPSFNTGRLNGDSWFTAVSYIGAFDPALPMSQQWTAGWTNFDPQNTQYVTAVEPVAGIVPASIVLSQNFPNPFNPSTTIRYAIPSASRVTLKVYDVMGREVSSLVDRYQNPGNYQVVFNATELATGVYYYRLNTGSVTRIGRMMLLK